MPRKVFDMSMVRGDTYSFDLIVRDIDPESIETIYFTVKKRATDPDSEAVFQKSFENGIELIGERTYRVRVAPQDTDNVAAKKYVYDIQFRINNDVYTMVTGGFNIEQDVTEAI